MNLYIATKLAFRADAAALAVRVRTLDVRVTSRWHDTPFAGDDGSVPEGDLPEEVLERIASGNHHDLNRSDTLCLLVRPGMQGSILETGVALGAGKRVFIVAPRKTATTVMARHFRTTWCADGDALLDELAAATGRRRPAGAP